MEVEPMKPLSHSALIQPVSSHPLFLIQTDLSLLPRIYVSLITVALDQSQDLLPIQSSHFCRTGQHQC